MIYSSIAIDVYSIILLILEYQNSFSLVTFFPQIIGIFHMDIYIYIPYHWWINNNMEYHMAWNIIFIQPLTIHMWKHDTEGKSLASLGATWWPWTVRWWAWVPAAHARCWRGCPSWIAKGRCCWIRALCLSLLIIVNYIIMVNYWLIIVNYG